MKTSERRKHIAAKIWREGEVKVDQLIHEYGVSLETIRRDLRILDYQGVVKRKYGGAVKVAEKAAEVPYADRMDRNQREKEAIAREAVKLLEQGDSLFIDGKTSSLTFARLIPDELELTVVTNSIVVARELRLNKGKCRVFMAGGEVDGDGMVTGPKFHQGLKEYHFDKAFFSAIAVNENGCYYSRTEPQQLARTLNEVSTKLILLADSSKINKIAFLFGLGLAELDCIVTDAGVPESFAEAVEQTLCLLIVASL